MIDISKIKVTDENILIFDGIEIETIVDCSKLLAKHPTKEIYFAYCSQKGWLYLQDENNNEFYIKMVYSYSKSYSYGYKIKKIDIKNMEDKDIHITLWDNKITRLDGVGHRIGGVIFEYDIDTYIGETKRWYGEAINPIGECCE